MPKMLEKLCLLNGASGDENAVRDFIIKEIKNYCEYNVDALGSIIALKKGRKTPEKKVMLSAHMDEVGFIITHISDDGYLKFSPVGGIDPRVVIDRVVNVNGKKGVIGAKAVHQLSDEEKKTAPDFSKLYIDIGAKNKADAEKYISLGDFAYFVSALFPAAGHGPLLIRKCPESEGAGHRLGPLEAFRRAAVHLT